MRTMLKADFITAVKNLFANGIRPEFYTTENESVGIIAFTDKNGDRQEERVYCQHTPSRDLIAARFAKWFAAVAAEFHAEAAEALEEGQKVQDGDTVRTVTAIRTDFIRSVNGTPRDLKRTGVVILDNGIEVMAGDVKPVPAAEEMTATGAIHHMFHTLVGAIEQSKKADFDAAEAYADIKTNHDLIASQCKDRSVVVWLRQLVCFGYVGDMTFEEVNGEARDRLCHILHTGWLPSSEAGAVIQLSTLFEMDWYGATDIIVTAWEGDQVRGTATITDTEGLYQFAFSWLVDSGEAAMLAGIPALTYITEAQLVLPYDAQIEDCDPLSALQEMDSIFGLAVDIAAEVLEAPDKEI